LETKEFNFSEICLLATLDFTIYQSIKNAFMKYSKM